MRVSISTFFLLALCFSAKIGPAQEAYPLRPAVECTPREGLPHVFAKLESSGPVRIAYLGGSITCQQGYRPLSRAWFQNQYPQADVVEINAGIGGTNSTLGVFRLRQDVLRHNPDLLFVEFAVNDGGTAPQQIIRAMEGIVRQTWKHNPRVDICFVYTLTQNMLGDLQKGFYPRAASAMEAVADYYGIPSIHMGLEVARLEKEGKVLFKGPRPEQTIAGQPIVFSGDGVHPYEDSGHQLYLEAIVRSMKPILERQDKKDRVLSIPLDHGNFANAQMIPIDPSMLQGTWADVSADLAEQRWNAGFATPLPCIWKTNTPGAVLEFLFKGTYAAVYDIIGPDCGQVQVSLDGMTPRLAPRIDAYCTYSRLSTLEIAGDLPDTVHQVRLELHPGQPDKAAILAKNGNTIDDPKRYADQAWYAGALLLLGELQTK